MIKWTIYLLLFFIGYLIYQVSGNGFSIGCASENIIYCDPSKTHPKQLCPGGIACPSNGKCPTTNCYIKPKNGCPTVNNGNKLTKKYNKCKIWAGGGGKPNDIIPKMRTKLPKDILPTPDDIFETRKSPYYTQYWTDISYDLETKKFGKLKISRKTSISIPGGTDKQIDMPNDGWPYIIKFDFMNNQGISSWNIPALYEPGGFSNDKLFNGGYNRKSYLETLKTFLLNGYAVICLSVLQYDTYPVYECIDKNNDISPWSRGWNGGTCWNNGNNLIRPYLNKLFNKIKNNKFQEIPVGNKFNYNNMGLYGYSGPAQMVSRCINNFPLLQTDLNICYPKIKASILIAGGSLHCYKHDDKCPKNIIEPNYDNGNICWDEHPPVLLCQYTNEHNADPNASTYYFNKLNEKGVPVYAMKQKGNKHAIPICNNYSTDICLKFIQKYINNSVEEDEI